MEEIGKFTLNTVAAPLVSCVMVTGKSPAHEILARNSIDSFLAQNYPNKELIIVNDGEYSLQLNHPSITEIDVAKTDPKLSLGELRNICLENAKGDWICQWDDDDYCHPHRLAYQMAVRQDDCCVLLQHQVRYSFRNNSAFICTATEGHAGTILHPKTEARYPSQGKAEDSVFWTKTWGDNRVVLDNNTWFPGAALYLRFYHGHNTWDEKHIMRNCSKDSQKDNWLLTADERFFLENVLYKYTSIMITEDQKDANDNQDSGAGI